MDLSSPSLLANIQKCSKKHHEQFCLGMGEWTKSSDKSSTESEVPKWKPLKKKLKLSVPKDKESWWQFVDNAMQAVLGKEFVPKNTTSSTKWAVSNFVAWRNGRNAWDQIHNTQQFENAELKYWVLGWLNYISAFCHLLCIRTAFYFGRYSMRTRTDQRWSPLLQSIPQVTNGTTCQEGGITRVQTIALQIQYKNCSATK